MYYRTASIILNAGQKSSTASDVFIAQPDHHKESLAGKLFILAEVDSNKSEALKVINFLINNINHNYYQNEKVVLRERIDSLKVEHIFETALAKTNKELVDFLDQEKIKISPYSLNITVAVIHEESIHFSTTGKNKNLLIYQDRTQSKDPSSSDQKEYRITEVSENKERRTKQTSLTKIFSEVTSGRIPNNGYFLLANEALSEYLSHKQLIEIITTLPPQGAATQIKNTLGQVNAVVTFLGVIIKNTTAPEKAPETVEEIEQSQEDTKEEVTTGLNNTEEETEKILAPSGVINFKYWVKQIALFFPKLISSVLNKRKSSSGTQGSGSRKTSSKAKLLPLKDKIFFKKRHSQLSFNHLLPILKRILASLSKLATYVFQGAKNVLGDKEKRKKVIGFFKNLPGNVYSGGKNSWNWLKGLNKKNKVILGATVLVMIFLVANIFWNSMEKEQEKKQANVAELVDKIESNHNEIEASLLYENEKGVKEITEENQQLISKLKKALTAEQKKKEKYQEIFQKQQQYLDKIRHAIDLKGAKKITDLANINNGAQASGLTLMNGHVYAGDPAQKTIYHVSTQDNTGTAIRGLNEVVQTLQYPVTIEDNIYYLNKGNILQLNTGDEGLTPMDIDLGGNASDVSSMASFRENIYLLSPEDDQIYKYEKEGDSFVGRQQWIREEVDLSAAADLAIDGNIYILKNDGKVEKYLRGNREEFQLDAITPAFQQVTELKVSPGMDEGYIYILEPDRNRLAVFNKQEGKFLMQYQDQGFTDLKDFAVDEENQKIYLLNGNSVYQINAEHLN